MGPAPLDARSDQASLLNSRNVGLLFSLGAAAWASKRFEDADRMARTLDGSPFDGFIDFGDRYGDGVTLGVGTLGVILAGHAGGDETLTAFGNDLGRALLLSWGGVWALKLTINARRPNGGPYSFPSGHTATAFAAAPVIAKHWGWRAGIPAYAVAASTALARMEDRRHYLADVLFGAAIGLVAGSQVVGGEGLPGFLSHLFAAPDRVGFSVRY
jgi:membrane-associated phospholipid phosphatase